MLKFIALSALMAVCSASKYGGGDRGYHSIELPVKSKHDLEVIPTHSEQEEHSTYVDVPGGVLPVYLTFKTQSSPVYVKQQHRGTKGSYQRSESHDEPHKLVHEVTKPVIQELREIITPFRKVVQVIQPVREEVLTKVHKGERKSYGGDDDGYGKGYN
jgi:hypothetical protein